MHFGDYTFIFLLALILFGPKKLPEIGRQIGRLMMEFRRASNEFKMQMDEELRNMDDQDRLKRVEASLKEQTDRVLAVAPQLEPLPSDPSHIVQALPLAAPESQSTPLPELAGTVLAPLHEATPGLETSLPETNPLLATDSAAPLDSEPALPKPEILEPVIPELVIPEPTIPEPARWHQNAAPASQPFANIVPQITGTSESDFEPETVKMVEPAPAKAAEAAQNPHQKISENGADLSHV